MRTVLLAGGTGGAKLAVGLRDQLHGHDGLDAEPPGQLTVIANTADDIEIYDAYVSPDPDLITFRLAGVLADSGFGIDGETHNEMDRRRAAGEEIWFELGDEDLAVCRQRASLKLGGATLTAAHVRATADYDLGGARVLPMSNQPVRTIIDTATGPRGVQEFLILDGGTGVVEGVRFAGIEEAEPSVQVKSAIDSAELIIVGPSNPAISIAPILELPKMADALRSAAAPVLGVSPLVGGQVLKGPTELFLAAAGSPCTSSGVADYYEQAFPGLIDAWIADEPTNGHPHHLAEVAMSTPALGREVAAEVLRYGASLAPAGSPL